MSDFAIRFENVSKWYRLGSGRNSLREALALWPGRLFGRHSGRVVSEDGIWALRDVDFEVRKGETLGIIGPNGAGKTTILKLLAGVTRPTSGQVKVHGKVAALIELGAGFHPDLTGRENIHLNGAILGLTKRQIDILFDEIVDFAELRDFIDTPVKRYSSGMYVRLGFAVAVHSKPDVLLVDEVLSVGDSAFQTKCYRKMAEFRRAGVTIVLVSHNMYAIRDNCDKTILLWPGSPAYLAESEAAITCYLNRVQAAESLPKGSAAEALAENTEGDKAPVQITAVTFLDGSGVERSSFASGEPMTIRIEYRAAEKTANPIFGVDLYRNGEFYCGYYTSYDGCSPHSIEGRGAVELIFEAVHLPVGVYTSTICISHDYEYDLLAIRSRTCRIQITRSDNMRGLVALPHRWEIVPGGD